MKPLYELRALKKTYGGRRVLDLWSLSLEKGKILSLLGPNGAGKTTLLEIMAFLSPPTSGEVWFDQKRVDFGARLVHLRRRVVLVQQHALLFTRSVARNVEFPMAIRRLEKGRRKTIAEDLLALVGMEAFRHRKAHRLSGGETQRVAIAQALACSPEVILLDEPTANVDVENQAIIERIMRDINETMGISVIFTTHDIVQASRVADETMFLFEGEAAQSIQENIFSGGIERDKEGLTYFVVHNQLKLRIQTLQSDQARISIDPSGVKIASSRSFTENTFKGRLIQVTDQKHGVRLLVDVGIPLSVLVHKQVFGRLHLEIGGEVWITCPMESIQVF